MSFINKNANLVLLFLIIISAIALVGATVFFQTKFEDINTEYNQKLEQLRLVSADLEQQQAILNKVKADLNIKSEREHILGEQFTEVKEDKEILETQKQHLESRKQELETELEDTESILQSTQNELEAKKTLVAQLTGEVDTWKSKTEFEEKKRRDAEDALRACTDAKALCTCP